MFNYALLWFSIVLTQIAVLNFFCQWPLVDVTVQNKKSRATLDCREGGDILNISRGSDLYLTHSFSQIL